MKALSVVHKWLSDEIRIAVLALIMEEQRGSVSTYKGTSINSQFVMPAKAGNPPIQREAAGSGSDSDSRIHSFQWHGCPKGQIPPIPFPGIEPGATGRGISPKGLRPIRSGMTGY